MSIILNATGKDYVAQFSPGIRELTWPKTMTLRMDNDFSGRAWLEPHKADPWTGEGLPPVGADVEVFVKYSHLRFDRFIGQQVHIVAHDVINGDPVAVFRMPVDGDDTEQDYHAMVAGSFRPIRTPEQIAAEEREAAIQEMVSACHYSGSECTVTDCTALYDAGYRKQVAP